MARAAAIALALAAGAPALAQGDGLWERTRAWIGEAWQSASESISGRRAREDFAQVWEAILPRLEETLELQNRHAALPENAWIGDDQSSNRRAIDALMDEAVEILSISPAQRYRARIRELEEAMAEVRRELEMLRRQRVSAPEDALLQKSVADYDQEIAGLEARLEAQQAEIEAVEARFTEELAAIGLHLDDAQLELLLSTVVGDHVLTSGVAFDNVKSVTTELERIMLASDGDPASARRYYGMYLVLLQVLERMHQGWIDAVEGQYLPSLESIIIRAGDLMTEAKELQAISEVDYDFLASNIEAQALAVRAAEAYREYLERRRDEVRQVVERLEADIQVARNTYETVKVSGELVALMQNSYRLLEALVSRQVPPLQAFENVAMKRELEKLTALLRSQGPAAAS